MAYVTLEDVSAFNETLGAAVADSMPLGLDYFPSVIELKTSGDTELARVISEANGKILAVFGIDGNHNFTVSFLPLDGDNKIKTLAGGEETWPAASVINFPGGIDKYMPDTSE